MDPAVVFPSSDPQTRSGPGALLWLAPRGCQMGAAGVPQVFGSTLDADDLPEPSRPLVPGAGDLAGIATAAGTALGQVVLSGPAHPLARGAGGSAGAFVEGRTVGAFAAAQPLGGPPAPVAATSAYLGDTVLASPVPARGGGWEIAVRVQRHYSSTPASPRLVPAGPGPLSAVAATMDYRADVLLVWATRAGVYARELPAGGAVGPVRRLGGAGAVPEIGALLSDDGHAIVAWRSQSAAPGGGAATAIELSLCEVSAGAALSSRGALTVERFRDPPRLLPPPGSLRLIRLSSEAVMMAWTGIDAGRYAVRASPVSLRRGAWAPIVVSAPLGAGDAVLADLVPGPHAEALALWNSSPRPPAGGPGRTGPGQGPSGRGGSDSWAILAARGHYAGHGEVFFEAPEQVSPPGPNGPPAAALDPHNGQALAAWVTGGGAGAGRIEYALRAAGPASTPPPASAAAARARRGAGGAHRGAGNAHRAAGGAIAPAVAALALLVFLVAAVRLRGAARRPGRHMRARGS